MNKNAFAKVYMVSALIFLLSSCATLLVFLIISIVSNDIHKFSFFDFFNSKTSIATTGWFIIAINSVGFVLFLLGCLFAIMGKNVRKTSIFLSTLSALLGVGSLIILLCLKNYSNGNVIFNTSSQNKLQFNTYGIVVVVCISSSIFLGFITFFSFKQKKKNTNPNTNFVSSDNKIEEKVKKNEVNNYNNNIIMNQNNKSTKISTGGRVILFFSLLFSIIYATCIFLPFFWLVDFNTDLGFSTDFINRDTTFFWTCVGSGMLAVLLFFISVFMFRKAKISVFSIITSIIATLCLAGSVSLYIVAYADALPSNSFFYWISLGLLAGIFLFSIFSLVGIVASRTNVSSASNLSKIDGLISNEHHNAPSHKTKTIRRSKFHEDFDDEPKHAVEKHTITEHMHHGSKKKEDNIELIEDILNAKKNEINKNIDKIEDILKARRANESRSKLESENSSAISK